jgi:hypothetical protein
MTYDNFERFMKMLCIAFPGSFKFDPEDDLMRSVWYAQLEDMEDNLAGMAIKKVIATCEFVSIRAIRQAYADVACPVSVDNEEGWGMVERAINHYGYMRPSEALESLPETVRQAAKYMGGFQSICQAENKEVIRGQFNKALSAINARAREKAVMGSTLVEQINTYHQLSCQQQMALENQRDTAQLKDCTCLAHDENPAEETFITPTQREANLSALAHIKDILRQSLQTKNI